MVFLELKSTKIEPKKNLSKLNSPNQTILFQTKLSYSLNQTHQTKLSYSKPNFPIFETKLSYSLNQTIHITDQTILFFKTNYPYYRPSYPVTIQTILLQTNLYYSPNSIIL